MCNIGCDLPSNSQRTLHHYLNWKLNFAGMAEDLSFLNLLKQQINSEQNRSCYEGRYISFIITSTLTLESNQPLTQ
jgi:hypothetical protein